MKRMMGTSLSFTSLIVVVVLLCCDIASGAKIDGRAEVSKIHPMLKSYYDTHLDYEEVSFIAILKAKANVADKVKGVDFETRGHVVFNELTTTATNSQGPLLELLGSLGVQHRAYWIVNMIQINANKSVMMQVAQHETVKVLQPNFEFKVDLEVAEPIQSPKAPEAIEWNINWVKAPNVWQKGFTGKGLIVANADTGVQYSHPALLPQYKGYGGPGSLDHNYNWWDAIHTTGSRCGANSPVPCDDNGHGTHTTGTAVGSDHATNEIGVAPDAKWIACRNMNAGYGTPTTYIECLQFFIAPTDLTGKNPNPSVRPHVIGNSWGCPPSEGCSPDTLQEAVSNTVAAGIFMSVSAGNSGPSCGTVSDPPALYADVMSVAASAYQSSSIASFSSRGPVTIDGSNRPKPDITAPGSSVRSAYPTNTYASLSGTSMASPHITGVIALLWEAQPSLLRNINQTTSVLLQTAISRAATACSTADPLVQGIEGDTRNNVYGYGELDCAAAISLAMQL